MKIIDLLAKEIRAGAAYNPNVQVAPSVILWTDELKQWEVALPLLQATMPELVVLGEYDVDKKIGPAIWIKCVIDGVLPEVEMPEGKTPIIYLPGVARRDLRAIASCPEELMPLAELQYRGCWWTYNKTIRDWTVNSFLIASTGGADLDVASDERTQQAMLRVLPEILECDAEELSNRRLEATDFNKLLSNDPVRDILVWMNDPKACRKNWSKSRWTAFVGICETEYFFNPELDGELTAAEHLCRKQGVWEKVWGRYVESRQHYAHLPELLLKVEPDLAADGISYPIINENEEKLLETDLIALQELSSNEVRQTLINLESRHADRRDWIWHDLGRAPLTGVLQYLSAVAKMTQSVFSGIETEEMATLYRDKYWQVDNYALRALGYSLSSTHQDIIINLLATIYTPWLDEVARNFQEIVKRKGYPGNSGPNKATESYAEKGEVVFFVDGLRYDISQRLVKKLEGVGKVGLDYNWAALPSVTATAKAAITPVHDKLTGRVTDQDFVPSLLEKDSSFSAHYLKKYLDEMGWVYLNHGESGDTSQNAWIQSGDIDKEGHNWGVKLASKIDGLLDEIVERVEELLAAGWQKIRIVTDHGWVLTPTPMEKVSLSKRLTETHWGRCALIKESADSGFQQVGWYWNPQVNVAMAPGVSCFKAGQNYDHGGLSLQECLTPVINIQNIKSARAEEQAIAATISDIRWLGLVCKVNVKTESNKVVAVLRIKPADTSSEISPRKIIKDGKCTLMVDDQYEDTPAVLVLLDENDTVLAKQSTLIGES